MLAAMDFKEGNIIFRRDDSRLVTAKNPLEEPVPVFEARWRGED